MEFDPEDQEVIRQLRKLKQADKEYPPELMAARRQRFMRRMGEISLGLGAGVGLQQAIKGAKALPTSTITSRLLETVLVVAIVAEAGAVTYFYRDKLADFLKTFVASPEIQEIISPPVMTNSLTTTIATPFPEHTLTPEALTASEAPAGLAVTPTQTPGPSVLDATNAVNATAAQANSTPDPNGNNGNHYGQTPKPERTKENNGNNDKPPKDDEQKPPKKDPPPKEDPKPTKAK